MDWARYKLLSDAPQFFTRWMLQRSLVALSEQNVQRRQQEQQEQQEEQEPQQANAKLVDRIERKLTASLASAPVPFPAGHNADPRAMMYRLELSTREAAHMVALFGPAPGSVSVRQPNQSVAPPARGSGENWPGFHAAWLEHYTHVSALGESSDDCSAVKSNHGDPN